MTRTTSRRFSFEKAGKLDDPSRLVHEPPDRLVIDLTLASGDTVIDLGAGTGYFALPIARHLKACGGGRVLALDAEPRMLALLEQRARAAGLEGIIETRGVDALLPDLPVDRGCADRAVLASLYHELEDPRATLRELHRVMRPGGLIVVLDWDPTGSGDRGPPRDHRVPPEEVERELSAVGFTAPSRRDLYTDFYTVHATRL
jgi:ubiquinone/menaquinone biosynthesis C-methylase UbiE